MDSLRAPLAFLRTLAVAGAMAVPALAHPSAEVAPGDSVTLTKQPTRTVVDADGTVIERYGDPDRLGRIVDHCKVGTGQDDAKIINHEHGYAVLSGKDIPSDHLTVPLAPITGVEDPRLTQPGAENYFADAWKDGRLKAAEALGTTPAQLSRDAIALTVNSQGGRSQDRLHIHADRLDPKLGQELKDQLEHGLIAGDHWTNVKPIHGDHQYRALWVEGNDLQQNPFQLVTTSWCPNTAKSMRAPTWASIPSQWWARRMPTDAPASSSWTGATAPRAAVRPKSGCSATRIHPVKTCGPAERDHTSR